MKNYLKLLLLTLSILGITSIAHAQKIKFIEGDKNALAGITAVKTQYTYEPMSVGKLDKEADYINKKQTEYNTKEAGKGDKWKKDWIADRTERYQPQFEELFQKHCKVKVDSKAAYTMIVKTFHTEPGFNIAIARKNAEVSGEIWVLDASGKVVAKMSFERAPGRSFGGYDYDTGFRIQEAYAALGKSIAKYFK